MDLDYDRKFEEMKKYIPFLESMIKRLESTNNGVKNPRKAQLDKIRSLRDLLLDKKKRMKMENLLKCEQVLVNLYAKVEQRDSMTDAKEGFTEQAQKEKSDLNLVRNKLKSVVSKFQDDDPETLPEIARATNTEVVCTPGSKEPALFQRRPNKASSPHRSPSSHKDDTPSSSKRHYTRVLMSPEPNTKEWLSKSDANTDKPLFSRRSPRRSPRRYSPSYKKERKKTTKQRSRSRQSKDLNITLKVPEESLGSLNTKDILSRIINCSDSDVDIDTLRGLRSQILGELKQTGTKDDISDLILKSYKKKEKSTKKNEEIEEGELSDSESEAIENIYGSLVVVNQAETSSNTTKVSNDTKQPRKIQICLVINSEKEKDCKVNKANDPKPNTTLDVTDFEPYTNSNAAENVTTETEGDKIITELTTKEVNEKEKDVSGAVTKSPVKAVDRIHKSPMTTDTKTDKKENASEEKLKVSSTETFKPNFYQPVTEEKANSEDSVAKQNSSNEGKDKDKTVIKPVEAVKNIQSPDLSAKIEVKKDVVSEIDILQALKNEILGETTTVSIPVAVTPPLHQPKVTKVASAQEIVSKKRISIEKYKQKSTPTIKEPLFSSVNKQFSPRDDNAKKQSLKLTEKECERFNFPVNVSPVDSSEDEDKQKWDYEFHQGILKSSESKNKDEFRKDFEFPCGNSGPKSPDHEDFADTGIKPPVIIPSDPIKNVVPSAKADIDMRTLIPLISPGTLDTSKKSMASPSLNSEKIPEVTWNEKINNNEKNKQCIPEIRKRTESGQSTANDSPKPYLIDSDRLSRSNLNYPNVPSSLSPNMAINIPPLMSLNVAPHMTPSQNPNVVSGTNPILTPVLNPNIPQMLNLSMPPNLTPGMVLNMNPSMTPSRMGPTINPMMTPIMTPNARSYEMTPRPNFDIDDYTNQKHVYAPIFTPFESNDFLEKDSQLNPREMSENTKWEDRHVRNMPGQREKDYHRNRNERYIADKRLDNSQVRMECPLTPNPSFGRMECPPTPNASFGRMDCPSTPNPSFGRMECPPTPNASFGRMDCPPTPNPSFGRMDCPPTPNPSFGRMECPVTPNPSFGRMETPMTPVHSFGRPDGSMTPSHSYGRSDNNMTQMHAFGRCDYRHKPSSFNHKHVKSHDPRLNRSTDYDKYQSRNDDRNRSYYEDKMTESTYRRSQIKSYEQDSRSNRERMARRESSVGRSLPRDYEMDDSHNKDYYHKDYQKRKEKYNFTDEVNNKRNYRARSIGRMNPPEETFSMQKDKGVIRTHLREGSIEKPISVQPHTGGSFNIDTSFNRTFQNTKLSSLNDSFDVRRQRASSVGRSLHEKPREDLNPIKTKVELHVPHRPSIQIRRACSVGRDLKDYNTDKNFKDIKEDLRSCKFNNYDFKIRESDINSRVHNYNTNEKNISNDRHSGGQCRPLNTTYPKSTGNTVDRDPRKRVRDNDSNKTKISDSSKYSPRKNIRDPRMQREIDVKNLSRDKNKGINSSSSHNKTYGIVYSNDNIAKGKILASVAGVKNFKIPKIKRPVEEKEVETNDRSDIDIKKEISTKNTKKNDNIITDQSKKVESTPKRLETTVTDRRRDTENISKQGKVDRVKSKEELTTCNKTVDKKKSNEENIDHLVSETSERRITRSTIKSETQSKQSSIISPVKKSRRIKKPLVYDSDSEDGEESVSNNENENKNMDGNKKLQKSENKETHKVDLDVEKGKFGDGSDTKQIDKSEEIVTISNQTRNTTINSTNNNNTTDNLTKKSVPVITDTSCEEQNDSLDISFGVDDELFSDNIASGSVLDNINALIADLDHDIEAPKINDFNDKFINNIVGSISSNDSPIPLEGNQIDFTRDMSINDNNDFVVDEQDATKSAQVECSTEDTNTTQVSANDKNSISVNDTFVCGQNLGSYDQSKGIITDKEIKDSASPVTENSKTTISEKCAQNNSYIVDVTENVSNDAIVSTTASDERFDETQEKSQPTSNNIVPIYSSMPDSTNNSNENNTNNNEKDLEQSAPDSTNELTSEINITSTHNSSDMSSKEQPSATSTSADNLPRIESIGKLLSILEDKNKIKELLTLLGKDSGENEKIKKKLEKLSEIVSDDEEDLGDHNEKSEILNKENYEKEKNDAGESPLILNDKNESVVDNLEHDKTSEGEKSSIQITMPSDNGPENNSVNDELKISDDTYQGSNIKQGVINIDENALKNNVPLDTKEAGSNIEENANENELMKTVDTEVKENPSVSNITDVKDIQEECKQISDVTRQENEPTDTMPVQNKSGKTIAKKSKITKKGRARLARNFLLNKRITRSEAGSSVPQIPPVPKKPSRELLKLQEDIRDMFISEDILNATGIRMCRLAKLVDEKHSKVDISTVEGEPEPIVLLENIKNKMSSDATSNSLEKTNKRKTIKNKTNETCVDLESKKKTIYKPGPKSKTKRQDDPYEFDTESIAESNNTVDNNDQNTDSDSDATSTKSVENSELLIELKKKTKRKRRGWQLGVIRKKGSKTKSKHSECSVIADEEIDTKEIKDKSICKIPDLNCFTDKSYCFLKNVKIYLCRLCGYNGNDIVLHYKKHHPHSEIPLSRLNPVTAKEAIEQSENMNLQAIAKIQTTRYVCRFCFQEFQKQTSALETFFWHVVSVHTGEYKNLCSECINITRCPFHLDIPPPPKNLKGQLIGYICGRCNFTQVSLENLKTHVIIRHDDEQTEVYSINLAEIPRKVLQNLLTKVNETSNEGLRVLRSTRSNQSITEPSDDRSDITDSTDHITLDMEHNNLQDMNNEVASKSTSKNTIQSKLIFENDYMSDTSSYSKNDEIIKASIKLERDEDTSDSHNNATQDRPEPEPEPELEPEPEPKSEKEEEPQKSNTDKIKELDAQTGLTPPTDVLDCAHFKTKINATGAKEYICCINGNDNHYRTTLLISFKKHVQLKHSENWDGYCFLCKVIVTGLGNHNFKDCLQHYLDKHIDNFPAFEENSEPSEVVSEPATSTPIEDAPISKPYINVRPLSELISSDQSKAQEISPSILKIQNVVSLLSSNDSATTEAQKCDKVYNYEESQSEIMTKKHRVVMEAMLNADKLIQVFKCAGRFCSYTTDVAEDALLHASTHQRIGGEGSLKCAYCDFDSSGNAIDLVMHVFKNYNHCSYACSKCFYRAAASQLVYAHVKRVHPELDANKVPVLSTANLMKDNTKDDLMSRDAAVLYYVCNNRDSEEGGICQFKSYVLTKFREHQELKHPNDEEFPCYMCHISTSSSKLLSQHLKTHGLRIYQCCRCLFGADSETDLLAHASEKHPLKQPKAYLRIITSKGGSSEVRVLPLAVLSKTTVETTVVTPNVDKECPVKQAKRSIDLENLIGQTNLMIQSMSTETNAAPVEAANVEANERQIQLEKEQESCSISEPQAEVRPGVLTLLSPEDSPKPSVTIKIEVVDTEKQTAETDVASASTTNHSDELDVVCLDSDEDSRQNIIDLSGDDVPAESDAAKKREEIDIRVPRLQLYKCPKCGLLSKSEGMFKRHIISCYPNPHELMKCAFCPYTTTANKVVVHYNNCHLENTIPYVCAICNTKFASLAIANKHLKLIHNETSTVVHSKTSPTGALVQYVIDSNFKERQGPKRKLSNEIGNKHSEPAPKLKKYGPQDVDKLPINPILDDLVYCSICEFSTKVRLNMVRHLQLHAEQLPVPRTAPINPVPHLESNEKYFDRMVNLASSSISTSNKTTKDGTVIVCENLSPEAAAMYPKYVPDKHRYTCGAKGCSYISVNESMFKIHWETLHAGTNDYHCVHCPPHQHLDTTKALTAVRIIAHLKMHDVKLYACSTCVFYHYTRKVIEKHLKEVHSGKLIIVREDGNAVPLNPPLQSSNAPTMDLKPWQCGLCKFKSMIRPEVIEHCGKCHQSKMQFKCTYCGFRTSNIENISKHQSKQHPGKKEDVFYYYYREGSIPDDEDGTPRWEKQLQKSEAEIKTEKDVSPSDAVSPKPSPVKAPIVVNLDIVKKEVIEPDSNVQTEGSTEALCNTFGQFCDPNGLKYKCSLCKVVIEDTKEAMQSHLYEELQYRKWGCAVCSYKAFHKPGLQQHVQTEHGHSRDAREPIELQVDHRIEMWVMKLLEHQTTIIEKNKENLAKQKAEILRANPGSSAKVTEKPMEPPTSGAAKNNMSMADLEKLFGPFGVPNNMNYTCPKCQITARSEAFMQEHLESELNKIRWCCNICCDTFQTYHEAQFHCRSVHVGQSSRPVEAIRDTNLRAAWVTAVLRVQKLSMNYMPVTETNAPDNAVQPTDTSPENSLLVVRYEEKVPTPEEQMKLNKKSETVVDKLVTEESEKKKSIDFECQYCAATYKYQSYFQGHVLKHYGLKPFACPYCPHTDFRRSMESHITCHHPNKSIIYLNTAIPNIPPVPDLLKAATSTTKPATADGETKIICLSCEETMTRAESQNHCHDNVRPHFGIKGSIVYRCWTCLTLHKSSTDFNLHHKTVHPLEKKNSSFYKLHDETRSLFCGPCNQTFGNMVSYRAHQQMTHGLKSYASVETPASDVIELDEDSSGLKRKTEDATILPAPKRVARKSTTKLPNVMAVARKSTTKLPFDAPSDEEECSYYGTTPSMDNLENVTTRMQFYNTFVPFTLKKLSEIIRIYPTVVVEDINKKQ